MKQFKEAGEAPEVRCDGTQGGRPLRREPPRSATRALRGRHAASAARLLARERRRDCGRPTRARAARAQTAPERLATKRGRALATCQRGVWGHAKAGFKAREDRVSPSANQMTQERGETGEKEEGTPKGSRSFRKQSCDGWRNISLAETQGTTGSDTAGVQVC